MNAKDLALAKINAGPKTFGFYAYGISLGMDIRTLASIINTPQGRAITKLCEGNVINGLMGTFSALQAILKLEGLNLYHDLTQFDVFGISNDPNKRENSLEDVIIENKPKKNASELVQTLFEKYYIENIENNAEAQKQLGFKPNTRIPGKNQINNNKSLSNMLYLISVIGKIDECIASVTNPNNPLWNEMLNGFGDLHHGIKDLKNAEEWLASVHLLLEYCKKYGDLVNTYYLQDYNPKTKERHYYAKDLKILAQGAEEMRVLGSILSSNKGVKSRTEEGVRFIKTIENAIIDRKEIMGLQTSEDDKIDYVLFCIDKQYRDDAILKYEEVKHSINILDVIATAPHFLSYVRTCCIPYAAFKVASAKFRARDRYYDPIVKELKAASSRDKEGVIKGIENACNYRLFKEWLAQEQMLFFLPKGSLLFTGRELQAKITEEDMYIPLIDSLGNVDDNGLATFKYYMDLTVIPELKLNVNFKDNAFVQGLIPIELTKTGTHAAIPAYSLSGNMMPHTDEEEATLLNYQADFSSLYGVDFPGSKGNVVRTIPSYVDAFYIYSQYVYGGKKGQKSLMAMFDSGECSFTNRFQAFEAQFDLENDFEFDSMELIKWCAPNGNPYNPLTNYFYAPAPNRFGRELLEKVKELENIAEDVDTENTEEAGNKKKKKAQLVETSPTSTAKRYFVNPTSNLMLSTKNSYSLGKNVNIINYPEFDNITITDPISGIEESFLIYTNYESGTYSIVSNDVFSDRAKKIVKLIEQGFESVLVPVLDAETGTYALGINGTYLDSLITEAIHEVDNDC